MNNVVIHIGLRKTATTWLQDELFSKLDKLNYLGKTDENYPEWLIDLHYLDDYKFEKEKRNIKLEIESLLSSDKINLISSEAFTNTSVIYSQANRIKDLFPKAKILITLRDPIDIIKSHYKLDIQDGINFFELENYLDWERTPFDLFKRKPIYLPDFFYDENIDYYQSLFDKENLLVLKYEDMINNSGYFFESLGGFLDIEIDINKFKLQTKKNESIKKDLASIKYQNFLNYLSDKMAISIEDIKIQQDDFKFTDTIMSEELEHKLKLYFKGKCFGYY